MDGWMEGEGEEGEKKEEGGKGGEKVICRFVECVRC